MRYTLVVCVWLVCLRISTAQSETVNWINFEQLEDSLIKHPKRVFVDFYADWCTYCKKMDRAAFRDQEIVTELNTHYYTVKMDVESADRIVFGDKAYINDQYGKTRNPVHEIPLLLGSRKGKEFSLPVIIILDENFEIVERYFEYISPEKMKSILNI